jgi:hypothetical protein
MKLRSITGVKRTGLQPVCSCNNGRHHGAVTVAGCHAAAVSCVVRQLWHLWQRTRWWGPAAILQSVPVAPQVPQWLPAVS